MSMKIQLEIIDFQSIDMDSGNKPVVRVIDPFTMGYPYKCLKTQAIRFRAWIRLVISVSYEKQEKKNKQFIVCQHTLKTANASSQHTLITRSIEGGGVRIFF